MGAGDSLRWAGLLLLGGLVACQGDTPSVEPEGPVLELAACRPEGFPWPALCGTHEVAWNPGEAEGRSVALRVVVLPARGRHPEPDPGFLLAGGPGQAASEAFAPLLEAWDSVNELRDLVLVDQRGTGQSHPLDCEFGSSLQDLVADRLPLKDLGRCAGMLKREGLPVQTWVAAEDLDDVRRALGYERLNVVGGSYGTRVALAYMRQHPEAVRLAILDGVAPPGMAMPLHFARDAQNALDEVLNACAEDPACHQAFPDLREQFEALTQPPAAQERHVTVAHPLTNESAELRLTPLAIAGGFRSFLYAPELTALLPWTVYQASQGNFSPWLAQMHLFGGANLESISMGMHLGVVCAEDVPFIDDEAIDEATAGTFLGRGLIDQYREACHLVPRGAVTEGFEQPVTVSAPTLVFSGEFDPVTSPRWGEQVAGNLPRAKHVVVAGAGHGTLSRGCIPDRLAQVLETGSLDHDFACARDGERLPFVIDFAGPPQK